MGPFQKLSALQSYQDDKVVGVCKHKTNWKREKNKKNLLSRIKYVVSQAIRNDKSILPNSRLHTTKGETCNGQTVTKYASRKTQKAIPILINHVLQTSSVAQAIH